jgi:hypothetical protein
MDSVVAVRRPAYNTCSLGSAIPGEFFCTRIYNSTMTRVTVRTGTQPILLIAPHGFADNDTNTDYLTEALAEALDSYAVINRCWQRADRPDYVNSIANCNNLDHVFNDPLKTEFLEPIVKYKDKILEKYPEAYVFHIHGAAAVRKTDTTPVDIILGYGAGNPPSFSCDPIFKMQISYALHSQGFMVYQGKPGGTLSGWNPKNLNQLFRRQNYDVRVQSVQLEFVFPHRATWEGARHTGAKVATAIDDVLRLGYKQIPANYIIKEY